MKKLLVLAAGLTLGGFAAAPAGATIMLVPPSSIQGANVLFNSGNQIATLVTGMTQGGTLVDFTGTTAGGGTTLLANGGQARLEGAPDLSTPQKNDTLLLDSLTFDLANGNFFNDLEFNLTGGTATSATFTVTDNSGAVTTFTNNTLRKGSNFFGLQGISGELIKGITISLNGGGIQQVRQIRLNEVAAAIPEPASWTMMIMGFAAMGGLLRARRRTVAA